MRLTVTAFLSVDGVIEIPQGPTSDRGGDGLDLAGWLVPYGDADMKHIFTKWFDRADAFLLGRKTYEILSANWPLIRTRTMRSPPA